MTKVSVLGLGYVGLPVAIAITESHKYDVIGFDIDPKKIEDINNKKSPFPDKNIDSRLKEITLYATLDESHLDDSDIFIVTVPTPVDKNYEPNLEIIISACKIIARHLQKGGFVIIESTINPGVCQEVVLPILEERSHLKGGVDFELGHCPERINPGDNKWNIYNIPRNIGSLSKKGTTKLANFYRSFLNAQINEVSSLKVAESTKIIENTFRDVNIAFVNELAKSFDKMGIDLVETIKGASNKPFGYMAHYPGVGVGGHCIAVDPYYLIKRAAQSGFDHVLLKVARGVNNSMPEYTVSLYRKKLYDLNLSIDASSVLLYGLSYKPNVGDIRESPSLVVKGLLEKETDKLEIYDPYFKNFSTCNSLEEGLSKVDSLIIATAHDEILNVDFSKYPNLKIIIDGRNCIDPQIIRNLGIIYMGVGR